jgi:enoyl-CoA hydratase/carnithine racemase
MNLALCCDVRLAGRRAKFDTRFLQLGLHPGGGHTWMFRRITGPQAVFATGLFGEVLDGAEAERVGLVWRCVDDDDLLDEARTLAGRAAAGPPRSPTSSSPSSGQRPGPSSANAWLPCSSASARASAPFRNSYGLPR